MLAYPEKCVMKALLHCNPDIIQWYLEFKNIAFPPPPLIIRLKSITERVLSFPTLRLGRRPVVSDLGHQKSQNSLLVS